MKLEDALIKMIQKLDRLSVLIDEHLEKGDCNCTNRNHGIPLLDETLDIASRTLQKWQNEGVLDFKNIDADSYITDEELILFLSDEQIYYGENEIWEIEIF